jgi:hypothetical protein
MYYSNEKDQGVKFVPEMRTSGKGRISTSLGKHVFP